MNVKERALNFALLAHKGQVRKNEPDKPMVMHIINVGNLLDEYGFDDNVIAAGYLHDVVEDTNYELCDILNEFGEDIKDLVETATEIDKKLSWEERKKHTIDLIKKKQIRNKMIVCADKISNLEDLKIKFDKTGDNDFSLFKRGYEDQKWYYENIYKSLIYNENENHPMFCRLKKLIDYIFNNEDDNAYLKDVIFKDNINYYKELKKIHAQKQEVIKLKKLCGFVKPFVIEFTGTMRTGKTTLINDLTDFFKKGGFSVKLLEEFTTSSFYKDKFFPIYKEDSKYNLNMEIAKLIEKQLEQEISKDYDIILVDRSLVDRMIWKNRLYKKIL